MNIQKPEHCYCSSSDGLYISRRSLSGVIAFMLILGASIFIAGYFYGKKETIAHLMKHHDQQFFGDHIYASLCQLYNQEEADNANCATNEDQSESTIANSPAPCAETVAVTQVPATAPTTIQAQAPANSTAQSATQSNKQYYAPLVGFGTQKKAQQCADRLNKQGMPVLIKKHTSSDAKKGKKITWYQLVTPPYTNRQELDQLVDRIAKVEKLKDVRILES